jgi:hypothetical protein
MMGDFSDAGLGVYSKNGVTYYTLDLGKSRAAAPPPIPEFPFPVSVFLFFAFASSLTLVTEHSLLGGKFVGMLLNRKKILTPSDQQPTSHFFHLRKLSEVVCRESRGRLQLTV